MRSHGHILDWIRREQREVGTPDDAPLWQEYAELRHRAQVGEPRHRLLPRAFALVLTAVERSLGIALYDVQLVAGALLAEGYLAEMATGEGKTLTATLPLALSALSGRGVHLITANDYLARRDAEWMQPAFQQLGLGVASITSEMPADQRRRAYRCDVTYGTVREFGFDFLRDRLGSRQASACESSLQRPLHEALIDEADSILLDEARTPLIIQSPGSDWSDAERSLFEWAADQTARFEEQTHFEHSPNDRTVRLTATGRWLVRSLPKPPSLDTMLSRQLDAAIERSIACRCRFVRDRDYIVRDGQAVIVDEFTGRLGEARKWREGYHQAVEAQEGLRLSVDSAPAARITVQNYVLQYQHLSGMSGTVAGARREFRDVYRKRIAVVPTRCAVRRTIWPPRVFSGTESKLAAIEAETLAIHQSGRPVLIGTRSIDKSEQLATRLRSAGIEHQVLNAQREAEEASIIADAGRLGRVTVATNMAGRGTDIRLGHGVAELGGLHVIGTELHESRRIDLQLGGRCARQGDPGTFRQFMALDDDLLSRALSPRRLRSLQMRFAGAGELSSAFVLMFRRAQRRCERRHALQRRQLLYGEQQRQKLCLELGADYYLDMTDAR